MKIAISVKLLKVKCTVSVEPNVPASEIYIQNVKKPRRSVVNDNEVDSDEFWLTIPE